VHRTIYGSLERFIGVLTEHLGGVFPTWLAPVQVNVIPVNIEVHDEYSRYVVEELRKNKIRVELDNRNEKLGYRMRESQTMKVPYTLVLGDKERDEKTVTYRIHGHQDTVTVSLDEFIELLKKVIEDKELVK